MQVLWMIFTRILTLVCLLVVGAVGYGVAEAIKPKKTEKEK